MRPAVMVSSELLKPARNPEGQQKFQLSAPDRLMRYARYQKRILFYALPLDVAMDIVKLLKDSLKETLVSFYPLAGRMIVPDSSSPAKLELDCFELSVKFSEAVTEATLAQLGDFEPSEFCDSLCDFGSCPPTYPWTPDHPLLYVQVTKFGCGGISLGVGFSHQAADGVSAWHFISSWAEVARTGSLSMPPETFYSYEGMKLTAEELSQEAMESRLSKDLGPVVKQPLLRNQKPELRTKKFLLDRDVIEKLKSAAAGEAGMKFSTFEVVCVHFWRRIARAKALPDSKFLVLVNCRGRVKSIPKSYFGNAIGSCYATAEASELVKRDISYSAGLLHAAILESTPEKIERNFALLDSLADDAMQRLMSNFRPFLQVVSSPRHPVYECDFGFGKPVNVTIGIDDLLDEKFYLFPSPNGDGGISAMMVLQPEAMQRFLDDHD